jgi:tetratricopeptide (TPR) repeat protein
MTQRLRWEWLGLVTLLAFAWLCLLPGLHGGFRFDDFVNLDALGKRGPIDNWPAFWRYLTSGTADPLGRPLSLLTFLLDGRDWPTDPEPFLRTNLLLHLLNGLLLFRLVLRLESGCDAERAGVVALLASGAWVLHPLLVSTTLYVVQREAMLPATWTLLALHAFVRARQLYVASAGRCGGFGMAFAIIAGTALAALSKANGVLLPLLALTLSATVVRPSSRQSLPASAIRRLRWYDGLLLVLPSLGLALYLALPLWQWNEVIPSRGWTVGERVLTEPRVVLDYLDLLVVPRVLSPGLFNDQFQASTNLLQPGSTLPALLMVLVLFSGALMGRKRWPRLTAGLLFFFAGHALESTTLPLELYFEHRNYLPSMLLAWPLASAIANAPIPVWGRASIGSAMLLVLGAITLQRADLWGQPALQAQVWASSNPDSPRAQAMAAMSLQQSGQTDQAAAMLLPLWRQHPGELQLAFNYANARCAADGLRPRDAVAIRNALAQAHAAQLLAHEWLGKAIATASQGTCRGLTLDVVEDWLLTADANRQFNPSGVREQDSLPLLGQLALARGDGAHALALFRLALRSRPNPDFAARLVSLLAQHGHFAEALALLDAYEQLPSPGPSPRNGMAWLHWQVLEHQDFWPREFAALRGTLMEDLARQHKDAASHEVSVPLPAVAPSHTP